MPQNLKNSTAGSSLLLRLTVEDMGFRNRIVPKDKTQRQFLIKEHTNENSDAVDNVDRRGNSDRIGLGGRSVPELESGTHRGGPGNGAVDG
jgi:hypothetical protein